MGKLVKVGVWEGGSYRGCVLFGRGTSYLIGSPFGLPQTEVCELVRVALRSHDAPVTRCVKIAFRFLKEVAPAMRVVVSFADSQQGHTGGIYKAGNWIYVGESLGDAYKIHGKVWHRRNVHAKWGTGSLSLTWLRENVDSDAERIALPPKYKYVMPLDSEMRTKILPQALPYPQAT